MDKAILEDEKFAGTGEDTDAAVDKIIKMIQKNNPGANTDMIYIAYKLAKHAHENQFRKSGEPYINHPVQIAYIAAEMSVDAVAVTACLLHDVVEDTPYRLEDIKAFFGMEVAELVDGVTKLTKLQYSTLEEQQVENLRKMFLAMAKDIRVIIVKLIDRLHNMRTLASMSREKQLEKARETLEVYAPLAHRLGMSKIKIELEDLALKYLDPVAYDEIRESISQKRSEREEYIGRIIENIKIKLEEAGIKGEVRGRAKHFYSIFRKMYTQNKNIDEIYDLFAVRVIVDSVADCYAVLGMVHEMYTPVPMRVKDYIAMPKPNMYQSLHTTVIGDNGTPFEIQIRTWEMHKVAEEGIAAHWKYKEGISGETSMDSKLEWVRQLLETQMNNVDSDDFLSTLKIDLFADEVFVFTPNGKVICLPAKSTVIDFAFAIHSEVGYKMSGAKVNGKIVQNNYILKNGEIVEILANNTHGPSLDWLKIVRTNQAKSKINQWFKKQNRDDNIIHGKELIEKELKRLGFTHSQLFRDEWVSRLLKHYGYQNIDDLYAGVGYGAVTPQKIVLRLRDVLRQEQREQQKRLDPLPVQGGEKKKTTSGKGIVVKGIDNCLVRLAGCCSPVPGDEIVGFITKGRGVSVHRADCPNMRPEVLPEEDLARFIEVYWSDEPTSSYVANIQIEAPERAGLMFEVSALLNDMHISCKTVNAFVNKKNIAVLQIGIEITSVSELSGVVKKIRQLPDVLNVTRISN
ncbi:MAG: bifunctional (p)ppGpp synthetase/guanosine-3',5'-bis(diphosphate) 3'-pyrophosphohydrolase [Clostridia bacterium]|nr:bifunctional (p)ppGpp synthetase/guanosine-3',5'-bis(diphosphate) 3'-pyrophosphohydrolase [Clostridia bacterium]